MSITLDLPPETENKLTLKAASKGLKLNEFLSEELTTIAETPAGEGTGDFLIRLGQECAAMIPEEEQDKIPQDLAQNYRHYLYGYPKV